MKKKRLVCALAVLAGITGIFGLSACDFFEKNDNVGGNPAKNDAAAVYQQAVELGYTGTLEEFLALLNGQSENNGQDGHDGVGIKSIAVNDKGELVILGTNGSVLFQKKLPLCSHAFSAFKTGLAPTCTSAGYNFRTCEKCGVKDYEVLPQTGHDYDDGTVVYAPDCTKYGLRSYTCLICGDTKTQPIEPTGEHVFENGDCIYCHIGYSLFLDKTYNGSYGYDYFDSLQDGEKYCALYEAIDGQVMRFHSDETQDAELTSDTYVLPAVNYAQFGLTRDEAVSVWKTYLDDKPLYYWISKTCLTTQETFSISVEEEYAEGAARAAYNERLYAMIEPYQARARKDESAYNAAFAYHDAIIEGIDYAFRDGRGEPEEAAWAHNITGVFEGRGAVCEGYARAFQLLLNVRGIENVLVTGKTNGNVAHAWNLVRLDDGKWYWYDLTFDDIANYDWGVKYEYFCATDESFLQTHVVDESTATGSKFLYELPARSTSDYAGDEIRCFEEFTTPDGSKYAVIGYDGVNLSEITASGENYRIPEEVTYRGRTFKTVSLANLQDGQPIMRGIFASSADPVTLYLPATVRHIGESALIGSGRRLRNIFVDEDNAHFCDDDGVLYTKDKYTLIIYPGANTRTRYAVPDETRYIMRNAFTSVRTPSLAELHLGKNVEIAGVVNWRRGYPTSTSGVSNVVGGEWSVILRSMTDDGRITVDDENANFTVSQSMLFDKAMTMLYAAFPGIETAVIPDTVMRLGNDAFRGCKRLKSVQFSAQMSELPSSSVAGCESLESIVLPEGLTKIGDFAFWKCGALESVVIPQSVTAIGAYAFEYCASLKRIEIPQNVTSIGTAPFTGCSALNEITVAEGNTAYVFKGGCLIETVTGTLVQGFDYSVIPNDGSVKTIANDAFFGCGKITTIVVPDGVTAIGDFVFANCSALTTLALPASLTAIGENVIMNVYNAIDVFYKGVQAQWEESGLSESFPKENFYHFTVYFYAENEPAQAGNYWRYVDGTCVKW